MLAAAGTTPLKAVSGLQASQAWIEVDVACFDDEADSLADRLALLHGLLYSKGREFRAGPKQEYEKRINHVEFEISDRVLRWSVGFNKTENRKVFISWTGPYRVKERLEGFGYVIESRVGVRLVRA